MGQAKRKGAFEERKKAAIKRKKDLIIEKMGGRDEHLMAVLRTGIEPFLSQIPKDEWQARREQIFASLNAHPQHVGLEVAKAIRVQEDEIAWYLFLCEQTLEDPLCVDSSQSQRILPFFTGIGERWPFAANVKGLDRKIKELLTYYKSAPDGVIFEILVALSYAAKGWYVELIEENGGAKSPDMVVRKGKFEIFIECKRLDRRTAYSEKERNEFLRIWDAAVPVLVANKQWVWLKATFHSEASTLPTDFLANILQEALPIRNEETLIHESADATIHARLINRLAVQKHVEQYTVKFPTPMLNSLLGGDWAPDNSEVTVASLVKAGQLFGCEAPILASYIDEINWACGITRKFDSEVSINKKAKDITKLLSEAVKQVPDDKPSIIHIAAETLEGRDVEIRRTEKVMEKIPKFITNKPVLGVRFHRFQANSRANMLFEFDETIEKFQVNGVVMRDIPLQVVVPEHAEIVKGCHWEIYE
jgi:hypothetical protein